MSGIAGLLATLPVALAFVLLLLVSTSQGAYSLRYWGPLAVFVLSTLAVVGTVRPLRGGVLAAVGGLWLFAGWSTLSIVWADAPGSAAEGGGRALLYAALFALPVVALPNRLLTRRLCAALVAGLGGVILVTYFNLRSDGASMFLAGRLDDPIGYRNGTAALFALAFWPLLCVSAARQMQAIVRAPAFAVAVLALGLAFMTQSRGVAVGFVAGGVVAVALGPDRVRRAWLAILAVAALVVVAGDLSVPYDTFVADRVQRPEEIEAAAGALGVVALACLVAMALLALLDGGLRVSDRAKRGLRGAAVGGLVLLALGGTVGALAAVGDPVAFVGDKVAEFSTGETAAPVQGSGRLGSTSGPRSELWRVALREFEEHPVVGVGESSYSVGYYLERRSDRNVTDPHSLPLAILAELGLVGAVLFAVFLGGLVTVLVMGVRRLPGDSRRWASALAAAAAVVLAQSTVDWLWLLPGLTGFALACAGLAVALCAAPETSAPVARRPVWKRLPSLVPLLAAVLVALLFLSDYEVRKARVVGETSVSEQLAAARTAQRLNPLALSPRYLQAGALETLGRTDAARRELRAALELEPRSFVTLALFGDLETRAGNAAAARAFYRRASQLNPLDIGLRQLAGR